MSQLSIIIACRDDDYGYNILHRLEKGIESNIKFLEKNNITYEYVIVDWCPLPGKKNLYQLDLFNKFKDKNIKHIIIDKSIIDKEKLNPNVFYEFFGKNAGVVNATGDYLLLTNCDIVLSSKLTKDIKQVIESKNKNNFYRPKFRWNMQFLENDEVKVLREWDLPENSTMDREIVGAYSGDFVLVDRNVFVNKCQGYDEVFYGHRDFLKWQTGMDSESCWNLKNKGIKCIVFDSGYFHIDHSNVIPTSPHDIKLLDGHYRVDVSYDNKPDWGYRNYNKEIIQNNVIKYSAS